MKRVLLLFISVSIGLGIGEVLLRLSGRYLTYSERIGHGYVSPRRSSHVQTKGCMHTFFPNSLFINRNNVFSDTFNINSLGFPDREWSREKKKIRIACLGDSFTQGIGSMGHPYPQILQSLFEDFEVMNWGISGCDPVGTWCLLKSTIVSFDPDIILVSINESDITEIISNGGFERFNNGFTPKHRSPGWEPVYQFSYMFRAFAHEILGLDHLFFTKRESNEQFESAMQTLSAASDSFHNFSVSHEIRCIFLFHQTIHDLVKGEFILQPVLSHAAARSYEFIDAADFFLKNGVTREKQLDYYWKDDFHYNETGYRLFSRAVEDHIRHDPPDALRTN